MRPLH